MLILECIAFWIYFHTLVVLPKRLLTFDINFNAQLYIFHEGISWSVQNNSQLSYLTLDIIDFTGAKFLINKPVWLKTCLTDFIIHLVTVLYMYSFGAICTHLWVIFVCQFISSNAHQLKCYVPFQALHTDVQALLITELLSKRNEEMHCTRFSSLLVESLFAFQPTSVVLNTLLHQLHKHSCSSLFISNHPIHFTHVHLFLIRYSVALFVCSFFGLLWAQISFNPLKFTSLFSQMPTSLSIGIPYSQYIILWRCVSFGWCKRFQILVGIEHFHKLHFGTRTLLILKKIDYKIQACTLECTWVFFSLKWWQIDNRVCIWTVGHVWELWRTFAFLMDWCLKVRL